MALAFTGLEGSTSSTDSSIYTTGTVQPGSGGLVLAAILSRRGSGDPGQAALTGNGITWVEEDTALVSANRRLTLLRGMIDAPTSGTISINFSGTTQTHCSWAIGYFSGADTGGTNGSGAIVQNPTATTGTGEATALTLAAFGSANNMAYGCMGLDASKDIIPGTDFTEAYNVQQAENTSTLEVEYKLNETAVATSWTGSQAWAQIGIEVKAATAAASGFDLKPTMFEVF